MQPKTPLLLSLLFTVTPCFGSIILDLHGYPNTLTVKNTTDGRYGVGVDMCQAPALCNPDQKGLLTTSNSMLVRLNFNLGPQYYYKFDLPSDGSICIKSPDTQELRTPEEVMSMVNNRTGIYVGSWNGSTPVSSPGIANGATFSVWGNWTLKNGIQRYCSFNFGGGEGWGGEVEVENPPATPPSLCSLNNQTINMNMSKNELNVNGLTDTGTVNISCTSGTPSNYTLRLTGSNVVDGRLSFGNGVSAQITLNGTQVAANGARITLPNLATTSLPLSASLVGTASAPGVTNANGILVLEAL